MLAVKLQEVQELLSVKKAAVVQMPLVLVVLLLCWVSLHVARGMRNHSHWYLFLVPGKGTPNNGLLLDEIYAAFVA